MPEVTTPSEEQTETRKISPDYVRISMAAAIELGLKPGKISGCNCGCINLLQSYPEGCYANCTYCGLARDRQGAAEDNSFIRVAWPLFETDLVARKIAEKEASGSVGRVCIAQVQDARAYRDLIDMTERVHKAAPEVPISALVSASVLNEERLVAIKEAGADIIGVGLDAASKKVFHETRGRGVKGPHDWDYHWEIMRISRRLYGAWKVNAHVIIGLGETDRELIDLFFNLKAEEICAYLFSFNPEPGTAMEDVEPVPIARTRRLQLVKRLIENEGLPRDAITFDADGFIANVATAGTTIEGVIEDGNAFMTDGCPDRQGKMACNRPYGSYRPGEAYRDYPFMPSDDDKAVIRDEMQIEKVWGREV